MSVLKSAFWQPHALSLLRIVAGFTFSLHGLQKVLGLFGGIGNPGAAAPFLSRLWMAGVLETVGGGLILLGLFTRPVAFVLCGEMAAAYYLQHAPRGPWPIQNGGELAVLYCFLFLYLCAAGTGPWSLDRLVRRK
ncbi:MAG TPA: DoxX family protein [Bryobacteraceae bacterium]|nr:DoxX family protein [Bryobacteraceae bacterium]